MDDQHEHAGEREQDEDRGLAVRPQAGDADDRRRGEQEDPRGDAHDAVVGPGRDPVLGPLVVRAPDTAAAAITRSAADVRPIVGRTPGPRTSDAPAMR